MDARDPHTAGHSGRVAEYADRIGTRMGLDALSRNEMRRGALFHDLGKIVVPDSILRKPGPLTTEERAIIQEHPVVGHDLLSPHEDDAQEPGRGLSPPREARRVRLSQRDLGR
ncbi:MAG: HD-GYP domain-containing protein [Thermoanaerobaculia bacterium]